MDEYNEFVFYLLAWLAFWLIIEIKILFTYENLFKLQKAEKNINKRVVYIYFEISWLMTARPALKSAPAIKYDCTFIIGNLFVSPGLNES